MQLLIYNVYTIEIVCTIIKYWIKKNGNESWRIKIIQKAFIETTVYDLERKSK